MVENRLLRVRLGSFGEINSVGGGVWEFKFRRGRGLRVYYTLESARVVLLLLGGDKRTQRRDIGKAQELLRSYKEEDHAKH